MPCGESSSGCQNFTLSPWRADLHCHSVYSDGSLSVEQLLARAKQKGLAALSITDHDTMAAYPLAQQLGEKEGIEVLPGVEFSAHFRGFGVHILGYGLDSRHRAVAALCDRHRRRRIARARQLLAWWRKKGVHIDEEELWSLCLEGQATAPPVVGRVHMARLLLRRKVVASPKEAFSRWLPELPMGGTEGPVDAEETLEVIHSGGGWAVIAHPHRLPKGFPTLALLTLPFDGIEAYYSGLGLPQCQKWIEEAKQRQWLATGGSDFHGANASYIELGSSWVGQDIFNALKKGKQHV